ncbi:DUF3782 domain-containing protein [Desulfothermus naphthae]
MIYEENLTEEVKKIIYEEIPHILEKHPEVKLILWKKLVDSFADKKETESKFEILLKEFHELKKESEQRWKELREESERKWEESERRWKKIERKWEELECKWEKLERKWEESERKWQELKEESECKWQELKEESERKWQELKEESERKWQELKEESERKWQELKEESERKWQELKEESDRRWEESQRQWRELKQESDQRWETLLKEIHRVDKRIDRTIGALGARWGVNSEKAFREAIEAVLTELTNLKVENYLSYDEKGEVFGHPDQIELDVVIKNGEVWVIEIKSSMSKADMYIFDKKVKFFEKQQGKKVNRKLVISPMIEPKAYEVAKKLGIEAYTAPEDVISEEE